MARVGALPFELQPHFPPPGTLSARGGLGWSGVEVEAGGNHGGESGMGAGRGGVADGAGTLDGLRRAGVGVGRLGR